MISVYVATMEEGIIVHQPINKFYPARMKDYDEKEHQDAKIGESATRKLAFKTMTDFIRTDRVRSLFQGGMTPDDLDATEIWKLPNGSLYVIFGKDCDLCYKEYNTIAFMLIPSEGSVIA